MHRVIMLSSGGEVLCAASAMILVLVKCRLPHSRVYLQFAADPFCAVAGLYLCVCRGNPLGLAAGGRYDRRSVFDVCRHP